MKGILQRFFIEPETGALIADRELNTSCGLDEVSVEQQEVIKQHGRGLRWRGRHTRSGKVVDRKSHVFNEWILLFRPTFAKRLKEPLSIPSHLKFVSNHDSLLNRPG